MAVQVIKKLSSGEKAVIGAITLGLIVLGTSFVCFAKLNAMGKIVLPNYVQGYVILGLALVTLIGTVALAAKVLGIKEGLKMIAREGVAAIFIITGLGALLGFFLRVLLPGIGLLIVLAVLYAGAVFVIFRIYQKV
jgi:hypothetical protein